MSTGNPAPTFMWTAPSAPQTSGSTVALAWTASDDTGIVTGQLQYKRVSGALMTGCGNAGATGWTNVTDAMATFSGPATMWTGSFTWTLPNATNGYYCFRAMVTDANNPQVVVVNPNAVALP